MNLTALLTDEDAVSPVIGVILMVAVTVILAAVISSFVLGVSPRTSTVPQAKFSYDLDDGGDGFGPSDNNDKVTLRHEGGEAVDAAAISVIVAGNEATSGSWSTTQITAGNSYTIDESSESGFDMEAGDDVRIVWTSPETDQSSTLSLTTLS